MRICRGLRTMVCDGLGAMLRTRFVLASFLVERFLSLLCKVSHKLGRLCTSMQLEQIRLKDGPGSTVLPRTRNTLGPFAVQPSIGESTDVRASLSPTPIGQLRSDGLGQRVSRAYRLCLPHCPLCPCGSPVPLPPLASTSNSCPRRDWPGRTGYEAALYGLTDGSRGAPECRGGLRVPAIRCI